MAASKKPRKVKRTLYCFRLSFTRQPHVHIFTWRDMFGRFLTIDRQNVVEEDDYSALLLAVDQITDVRVKGHFDKLRADNPRILDFTAQTDLTIPLKPEQNLIERAHFIYYPNTSILVAEYNHAGTRAFGKFGQYIAECVPEIKECTLRPYIRRDSVEEASRKKGKFKKYELKIAPVALSLIEETLGLGVSETLMTGKGNEIEPNVTIKIEMSAGRGTLPHQTQAGLLKLIERFRDFKNRDGIKTAKITADNVVDLFGGEYFHKVTVLSLEENSRVVISTDMYDELDKFYYNHVLKDLSRLMTGS